MSQGATTTFYGFTYDPQGNLVATQLNTNSPNNTSALTTNLFDPYGDQLGIYNTSTGSAGSLKSPFAFGGQWGYYKDLETGLYLLGSRYYDPGTGRFLNRDPIGYAGGQNLSNAFGGNPVNESDPSGTQERDAKPGGNPWISAETDDWIEAADAYGNWKREQSEEQAWEKEYNARVKASAIRRAAKPMPGIVVVPTEINGFPAITTYAIISPEELGTGSGTNQDMRNYISLIGKPGDQTGHVIGKAEGGPGTEMWNVFPQNANANTGAYRVMSKALIQYVRAGNIIAVRYDRLYSAPNMGRPFEIRVTPIDITGQRVFQIHVFPNK